MVPLYYRQNLRKWFLTTGTPDFIFNYGNFSGSTPDIPVVGDWDGNGTWTAGVVEDINGQLTWKLRNSNSAGSPDITPFVFGTAGQIPLTGTWVFPN